MVKREIEVETVFHQAVTQPVGRRPRHDFTQVGRQHRAKLLDQHHADDQCRQARQRLQRTTRRCHVQKAAHELQREQL